MSEKYPGYQYNLLKEFEEADKARELEEKKREKEKTLNELLDEMDQEPPDPYGDINPAARNYEADKAKKIKGKKVKPKKRKLSPEEKKAREQERLMRRHYDNR